MTLRFRSMLSPYRVPGRVLPQGRTARRRKLTPARLLLAIALAMVGFGICGAALVTCALVLR